MAKHKKKRLNYPLIIFFSLLLAVITVISSAPFIGLEFVPTWDDLYAMAGLVEPIPKGEGQVHFIDVGQADCTLLASGGNAVLIDGGNNSDGELVVNYLRSKGIKKLDYIIATHHHEDHIGGLDTVIESLEVKNIIIAKSAGDTTTRTYEDLLLAIAQRGVKVIIPKVGDEFKTGDISFSVLAPQHDYSDENNRSICIRAVCAGTSLLLAGDAEKEEIEELLAFDDIRSTILKALHHGSKTSNTQEILDAVQPEYIVIPVGADNSYGHPSESVLTLFENSSIPYYRTDLNGTVVFSIKKTGIEVISEK